MPAPLSASSSAAWSPRQPMQVGGERAWRCVCACVCGMCASVAGCVLRETTRTYEGQQRR